MMALDAFRAAFGPCEVGSDVAARIGERLAALEAERGVRVLYAVESGSRAWGFPSPDSDYDIRFIYIRPLRDYIAVSPVRDVIECPIGEALLDFSGWDLPKTLGLFAKSNPALLEWLVSPIVYLDRDGLAAALRDLIPATIRIRALASHYASLTRGKWADLRDADRPRRKTYLYTVRPLCSLLWILRHGHQPPMDLPSLVPGLDLEEGVILALARLVKEKRETTERGLGERIDVLHQWIAGTLPAAQAAIEALPAHGPPGLGPLDALLRQHLGVS